MYLVTAIPLTFIPRPSPQVYTYFASQAMQRGSLVEVPIAKRSSPALVISCQSIQKRKQELKKSPFKLKKINRVLSYEPVICEQDLNLALWVAEYYFEPLGLVLKSFVPRYLFKGGKKEYNPLIQTHGNNELKVSFISGTSRLKEWRDIILEVKKTKEQFLLLFPEILSVKAFREFLGKDLATKIFWADKKLTPKQDYQERLKLLKQEYIGAVGLRGAVTLTLPRLKKIIIDDESNQSHVSWDQHPRISSRKLAIEKAKIYGAQLILGGILPSIEIFDLVKKKANILELPKVASNLRVIDMRDEIKAGNKSSLSGALKSSLRETLERGEKALLIVNRRGAFTVVLCRDCGHVLRCPDCDASLITVERGDAAKKLFCRYCATMRPAPEKCPMCTSWRFKYLGSGTQRVVKELKDIFTDKNISRIDSDITQKPEDQALVINDFNEGKIDILVGTTMAVKPNILKKVSHVAILNFEAILSLPEYNGEENVLQWLAKIASICENGLLWQTYQGQHRVFKTILKSSYADFLKEESQLRKKFNWPPHSQLIKLVWYDRSSVRGEKEAQMLYERLNYASYAGIGIYEPVSSTIRGVGGKYEWSILLKIDPTMDLKERNKFLSLIPSKWDIDVDPISTL